jgi:hypothetical protein
LQGGLGLTSSKNGKYNQMLTALLTGKNVSNGKVCLDITMLQNALKNMTSDEPVDVTALKTSGGLTVNREFNQYERQQQANKSR